MFGVDLEHVVAPFVEKLDAIVERLDQVILLLEAISSQLDGNLPD